MTAKDTSLNELGEMLRHWLSTWTKDEVRSIVRDEVRRSLVKEKISAAKLATKADVTTIAEQVASTEPSS